MRTRFIRMTTSDGIFPSVCFWQSDPSAVNRLRMTKKRNPFRGSVLSGCVVTCYSSAQQGGKAALDRADARRTRRIRFRKERAAAVY